jgi:outer membrane immunogenic protein
MRKFLVALLAGTALAGANSVFAADLTMPTKKEPPAPMAAPAFSWTGLHIGLGGGAAMMRARSHSSSYINDNANGIYSGGGEQSDLGKFGGFGTIQVGGDYQLDKFVIGAFGDFDLSSLKAGSKSRAAAYCHVNNNNCNTVATHSVGYKVGNSWDAGARLGYLINDRSLVYGLGGFTSAQISSGARLDQYVNTDDNGNYHPYVQSQQSGWKSGYLIGVGYEMALTDHITFKTEYRYSDYGTVSSHYSYDNGPFNGGASSSANISVQSVRAMLSYKF